MLYIVIMRTLKTILRRSINEELDNNFFWMIHKWFEHYDEQEEMFNKIVNTYINAPYIDNEDLKNTLNITGFNDYLIPFVKFIDNIIVYDNNINYFDRFKEILKNVIYRMKIKGAY